MSIAELSTSRSWLDEVLIRPLIPSDLPALEWEGAYTHFRRVYARALDRAECGQAALWVAQGELGALLGQIFVLLNSEFDRRLADGRRRAFIHSFRVRPEFRRRGLGTRLLAAAESDLMRRGFNWAVLNVARDNLEAIRLYERRGYRCLVPVFGVWTYEDHLGLPREVREPGWCMGKSLD